MSRDRSIKELSAATGLKESAVSSILRRLREQGRVGKIRGIREEAGYLYGEHKAFVYPCLIDDATLIKQFLAFFNPSSLQDPSIRYLLGCMAKVKEGKLEPGNDIDAIRQFLGTKNPSKGDIWPLVRIPGLTRKQTYIYRYLQVCMRDGLTRLMTAHAIRQFLGTKNPSKGGIWPLQQLIGKGFVRKENVQYIGFVYSPTSGTEKNVA